MRRSSQTRQWRGTGCPSVLRSRPHDPYDVCPAGTQSRSLRNPSGVRPACHKIAASVPRFTPPPAGESVTETMAMTLEPKDKLDAVAAQAGATQAAPAAATRKDITLRY